MEEESDNGEISVASGQYFMSHFLGVVVDKTESLNGMVDYKVHKSQELETALLVS